MKNTRPSLEISLKRCLHRVPQWDYAPVANSGNFVDNLLSVGLLFPASLPYSPTGASGDHLPNESQIFVLVFAAGDIRRRSNKNQPQNLFALGCT